MVIVEELVDSPDCESGALRVRTPSFTQPLPNMATIKNVAVFGNQHRPVVQWLTHLTLNQKIKGSNPFRSANSKLSSGVIGNTSDFGSEECKFEPCGDNYCFFD